MTPLPEPEIIALAVALGAREVPGWSLAEELLTSQIPEVSSGHVDEMQRSIQRGDDPLGTLFNLARSPRERRGLGATYTPQAIVRSMVDWAASHAVPARVVDPGVGSGRFLVEAGMRFPEALLIGSEIDPFPAILARANLATHGLSDRSTVILGDYRSLALPPIAGRTLFLGNPPYVRHHQIEPKWKDWLGREATHRGLPASRLAGLHVHFYLATAMKAIAGDYGTFITAAEWLDVNYGSLVRQLFLRELGGCSINLIEPTVLPFADAATTAAITTFEVGSQSPTLFFSFVGSAVPTIPDLSDGTNIVHTADPTVVFHEIPRERLEVESRWSRLSKPVQRTSSDHVELGEICRVHRGQVTGANKVWIAGDHAEDLPTCVLFPTITKARELFQAGRVLNDARSLRRVIDLPLDLDHFDGFERLAIDRFLDRAKLLGTDTGYIARTRRPWWSVRLRPPAPILATYMARRPPAFVRNLANARHINIAHGLYPRQLLSERALTRLIEHLSTTSQIADGRTYAGGLTKFEPKEMERLLVPRPELLERIEP